MTYQFFATFFKCGPVLLLCDLNILFVWWNHGPLNLLNFIAHIN